MDIFCYGMISPSTVYVLDDRFSYPAPNQYAEYKQILPSVGGEAVNSAIVLSKLGVTTKLDANWLNPKGAEGVLGLLKPFGIDVTRLTIKEGCGTDEVVITDKTSRTVFGNYAAFHDGPKQWNDPQEIDIQNAKVVALDPYFREESRLAAELCVRNNTPYVSLDAKYDDSIALNASVIVMSHELRDQFYPNVGAFELFGMYHQSCKGLVIFTFGSDELWYARPGTAMKKYTPYKIKPVDTTGAGDAFRGAIAYGVLKGWDDERMIDFASAVAACVCMIMPHTLNAPGLAEVEKFIKARK